MNRYERAQIVRTYECDGTLVMRPETILHWVQDIAEEHASTLGFGYDMCAQNALAWVEVKLLARIHRMPVWKEEITVKTWSYPLSAVIAGREFSMCDRQGDVLIEVATQWVLIDVVKRRPVALKKHLSYFDGVPIEEHPSQTMENLAEIPHESDMISYKIGYHTVDFNQHVNNSFYLLWALDSLPERLLGKTIHEIRIDFKKESMPGEIINISAQHSEACSLFSLYCDTVERARIKLAWAAPAKPQE